MKEPTDFKNQYTKMTGEDRMVKCENMESVAQKFTLRADRPKRPKLRNLDFQEISKIFFGHFGTV